METSRTCSRNVPPSCINNIRVRISVSERNNYFKLKLCSNSQCLQGTQDKWIKCDKMCVACKSIFSEAMCDTDEEQCEMKVVNFLDSYCAGNTQLAHTTTVTTTQLCPLTPYYQSTVTKTVIVSPSYTSSTPGNCTQMSPVSTVSSSQLSPSTYKPANQIKAEKNIPLIALGILLSLLVVLLVNMAIGWIWTSWIFKKKIRTSKVRI